MPHTLLYHPDIRQDLADLPKNIRERIRHAIEERVLKDPVKFGAPLKRSLQGYRKLRVGDYRVIYRLEQETIVVLKIGHRKEVYGKRVEK